MSLMLGNKDFLRIYICAFTSAHLHSRGVITNYLIDWDNFHLV